jgi:hypothetical protein
MECLEEQDMKALPTDENWITPVEERWQRAGADRQKADEACLY